MSIKVTKALQHLQSILPLKINQDSCSTEIQLLHKAILKSFIANGRVLNKDEMHHLIKNLDTALQILQEKDLIVFDAQNNLIGAYPLTMDKREHKILVNGFELNAMCALDALSVSSLFNVKTAISSHCRITQSKIFIEQDNGTVTNLNDAKDIHVGIAWSAASTNSCCANNLCLEMIYLIDTVTANDWLGKDSMNREIFTLSESIKFGALFFNPLLDS